MDGQKSYLEGYKRMLSFIRYSLKPFDDIGCAFPEVYFCCFDDFFVDVIQNVFADYAYF